MKQHIPLVLLLLVLGLSACGSAPRSNSAPTVAEPPASMPAPAPPADAIGGASGLDAGKAAEAEAPAVANAPGQANSNIERLVIKTASLTMQVESVRDTETAIRSRVAELKGYIVTVQSNGSDEDMTIDITFRVPVEQFDVALNGVQGLAKKVTSRTLGGEDVTEEFVDLESRLRSLEASRDRMLDLLSKADTVESAIAINQALTDVQSQIEQIQGRMKYLKQSAALSTISVALRPVPAIPPLVDEDSWQPFRVAAEALRNLIEFGEGLVNFLIVLLIWVPIWGPILLLLRWAWRKIRGAGKPKAAAPPPPTTPAAE